MFSLAQQKYMAILPRICAAFSLLSCCYILYSVVSTSSYRKNVYHRLMSGFAATMALRCCSSLWGPAAAPVDTQGIFGALGNTTTCTIQGFLNQMGYWPFNYCVGLTFYSYMAVRNQFNNSIHSWVEKLIHVLSFCLPFASAIYLASIEAFNFDGYLCWIASLPQSCGDHTGIECTRGPQRIMLVKSLLGQVPWATVVLVPTLVLIALYCKTRNQQIFDSNAVLKQASLYVLILYWHTTIFGIDTLLFHFSETEYFGLRLFTMCNFNLSGFYVTLVYLLLRGDSQDEGMPADSKANKSVTQVTQEVQSDSLQTFSIFDGTVGASDSPLQEYVFEADSIDEKADREESTLWEGVIQC